MMISINQGAGTKRARALALLAALAILAASTILAAPDTFAQGSRKDDIVFGPSGHPVAGATVTVCQAAATGTPCSPLATIYTDATLTVTSLNPFKTDGIGNYHFYAPAGRYMIQISGPGISGTMTYPDVILPADVSSSSAGNNISAFGLTLGGNLSVAGNATINGTLTTSNFNPGTFTPSSLSVSGNETVGGPRPHIDVTSAPYGAKGDGVTDDTAAIQAAITAACSASSPYGSETIFFPPGVYVVTQTQTPSTAAIFTPTCGALNFEGAGGNAGVLATWNHGPISEIIVHGGASPNAAPVFQIGGTGTPIVFGAEFKNLEIAGYNEAVWYNGQASHNWMENTALFVQNTGMADNVPLKITNTLEHYFINDSFNAPTTTSVPVLIDGENPGSGSSGAGGLYFYWSLFNGGSSIYDQRYTESGTAGGIHFVDDVQENCGNGFFTVETSNASSFPNYAGVWLDGVTTADCSGYAPLVTLDSSGTSFSDIDISKSQAGRSNSPAIWLEAGTLNNFSVPNGGTRAVVDANGNPVGQGYRQNNGGGFDMEEGGSANRLRSDYDVNEPAGNAPSTRFFAAGNPVAGLGFDPVYGVLFNSPMTTDGFGAYINQPAAESLGIGFAKNLPPTNIAGAATAGGSLAAGTYYYSIRSNTSGNCSTSSVTSAPAILTTGVVVGGSNNAVNLTWTAPTPGPGSVVEYCLQRSTSPITPDNVSGGFSVSAQATSYLDTGANPSPWGGLGAVSNPLTLVHAFTTTSLGVNTTNPQYNLDVNGTAAVNSLNGVQMAERFPGSDAAAKINACLTAASTTSGICNARGMTGTLTGASHIAIPAGTTLLWGQGQLTISDTTTKDAIELMGDGAAIKGTQESGLGTVPRPDASGFIACGIPGCTTIDNPNAATRNVDWVHIEGMYLLSNGANSKVINLTSVGHTDIENNQIVLGTGGNSYGIFGDTSTGDLDSTNTLIKHNDISPETTGDTCAYLAGVFNVVVLEQNSCYLPPGASVGFEFNKDSNGNYPNNDEFYGNDCETASQAFNQICYDIVGAQSVTIGPNNRCENVYNCFQFPSDGSAVGIHVLDPYLSLTDETQVKPNEPASAMIAIDNNGHNWTPSMHFGMNDLGGPNLLGNAGFEGWQNLTTLYYWGGASGTNINQPGTGIYQQETSAGANPGVDAYTQGMYNARVGDGATAGLGVNSGCIQVDATTEYTLMFRVASASTSNNFRPGFRFYSDANCTEADRITSASANARVLTPANYMGYSALAGTGPNWQSTNASLTYNNGITCNCHVTGADWQVAAANTWTPTRNFGIIFRVPDAYGSSSTVTHSMRVYLLENTAASNNYVYFDDTILSQGPVSTDIRTANVHDSGNSPVYGSLALSQHLNQGAAGTFAGTVALSGGTASITFPTPYNSAPVCTANDTSAIATVRTQATATTLTLTQSSGTDTIAWICLGNPN